VLEDKATPITRDDFIGEGEFPTVVGMLEKTTRLQAEKEQE
jgi:hypothetical protein